MAAVAEMKIKLAMMSSKMFILIAISIEVAA